MATQKETQWKKGTDQIPTAGPDKVSAGKITLFNTNRRGAAMLQ